jgi:hypothetical protein
MARAQTLQIWSDTIQYKPAGGGTALEVAPDAPCVISIDPPTKLLGRGSRSTMRTSNRAAYWMVPGSHLWGEQKHLWTFFKV